MTPQIVIAPPEADFVFIVSASWWLWASLGVLILVAIVALVQRGKK